jgi:hypothetical protein
MAYISGALTGMPENEREKLRQFYLKLGEVCENVGLQPYIPHLHGDPTLFPDLTPEQVDFIDRSAVTQSLVVVAYVGIPSTGVGIEIELAHHASKPVILLYEKERLERREISRLVRGNPALITHCVFGGLYTAEYLLRDALEHYLFNHNAKPIPALLKNTQDQPA